jgi:hypothetical protein
MSIRSDSYSSVDEVTAFTRHLLDGARAFSSETRPTLKEVERMIDRASAQLNMALVTAGFSIPVSAAVPKIACDDWVTARAAEYVELTQRGVGYSTDEGSRTAYFTNLTKSAKVFVQENRLGFITLGVGVSGRMGDGLQFTGLDAQVDRSDPDDTSLEQPKFSRGKFDNPQGDTE